eukprot:m.95561 g.95561  ORF g.95561 m.95561 type:complete len:586 (+) comp13060_c0_seq1:71-1828(+)
MAAEQYTEQLLLHRLVFENDVDALGVAIASQTYDLNEQDGRGRTPLRLAVRMNHERCVQVLLDAGADLGGVDAQGWSIVHEATATGNAGLLGKVLSSRNYALYEQTMGNAATIFTCLQDTDDFSIELQWEFSTWVPFMGWACPSDTCRIYKRGTSVRMDMTLLGFENNKWVRGNRSIVISATANGDDGRSFTVETLSLDHDSQCLFREEERVGVGEGMAAVTPAAIHMRLQSPITSTRINKERVGFERVKAGVWGFQHPKSEQINGFDTDVYHANTVEITTKTRLEHLPPRHPQRRKQPGRLKQLVRGPPRPDELAAAPFIKSEKQRPVSSWQEYLATMPPPKVGSWQVQADDSHQKVQADVGTPRCVTSSTDAFSITLWMAKDFPLSLQDQVLPVIDLLSPTSKHIRSLKDFISLSLPAGFPVKVEVPVYHVLKAQATFSNFVPGEPDAELFQPPAGYRDLSQYGMQDEMAWELHQGLHAATLGYDMELRQAVQLSLAEAGLPADGTGMGDLSGAPQSSMFMSEEEQVAFAIMQSLEPTQPQMDDLAHSEGQRGGERADAQAEHNPEEMDQVLIRVLELSKLEK